MITSIVIVNATWEAVHPAKIAIVKHCHALVSANPPLWGTLNVSHFLLKIGFNMFLVAFGTQKK